MVNGKYNLIGPVNWQLYVFNATRVSRKSSDKGGESDICELYAFPNSTYNYRFTSLYFFVFFYLGLLTTDVARSGQRLVPFLKPHSDRLILTLIWPLTQLV